VLVDQEERQPLPRLRCQRSQGTEPSAPGLRSRPHDPAQRRPASPAI